MLKSLKQLLRTPVKAVLFFLLMTAATALLVLGVGLWLNTQHKIDAAESTFTTIGTVTQKENAVQVSPLWSASTKSYMSFSSPVYDSLIDESVLDFSGAEYLAGPERRPYYTSVLLNCQHSVTKLGFEDEWIVAEFEPLEDCVPMQPVQVKVKRILFGNLHDSDTFWFCDHYTESPEKMEAGKTYISIMHPTPNMHAEYLNDPSGASGSALEMTALNLVYASQYTEMGEPIKAVFAEENVNGVKKTWEEVTADFYGANGRGKYWESFASSLLQMDDLIPVLPTDSLKLLPTFHEKDSFVEAGREITAEEFESGAAVCLISADFANLNGLHVGDTLPLALLYASYQSSPALVFSFAGEARDISSLIDVNGEPYTPFWQQDYEIVGLYRTINAYELTSKTAEMGYDMAIIPAASVGASAKNNIAGYGVMTAANTSFQIPNGTVDDYMAAYNRNVPAEVRENLEITFDDNGYSQIIGGLFNMRYVAIILFAAGLLSALAILVLLLYFFIVKQKKRTAIERSLGMSKNQCRVSLVSGVVVLSAVAMILGTVCSSVLFDKVQTLDLTGQNEHTFSTEYSLWARDENAVETEDAADTGVLKVVIPAAMTVLTAGLSVILVNRNLKQEPIELLSARVE